VDVVVGGSGGSTVVEGGGVGESVSVGDTDMVGDSVGVGSVGVSVIMIPEGMGVSDCGDVLSLQPEVRTDTTNSVIARNKANILLLFFKIHLSPVVFQSVSSTAGNYHTTTVSTKSADYTVPPENY
jgi:hypothetical protein